jgi:long-chain acyl-CoA synthetase
MTRKLQTIARTPRGDHSRPSNCSQTKVDFDMNGEELILVTGATGFLGVQLVRELLARHPNATLALLIRDRGAQSGQQRADSFLPSAERSRVQVFPGDVSRPNCGLDAAAYARLSAETTRVIHSAATVRFDHSLDEARRINVEGTRKILDFACGARHLRSFAYVGTAYVAGERSGLVRENELAVGQNYRNTYEQTKAEAEALVQSRLASLPGVILRPSIIVGNSRTGVTSSFKMMYWPLKIYARGLWRTIPGYPDAVLDIVPVDFVANAVAQLLFNEGALGSTVHLCAGPYGSATIQQVARRAMEYFSVPEPRYVDPKFFFAVIRPLLFLSLWGRKRRVLRDGRAYRDYFTMRLQFDTSNAERLLQTAGVSPPPVLDYLDRLFHYCVASDWGRKPIPAQ